MSGSNAINDSVLDHSITIVDVLNRSVSFSEPPKRIIAANQGAVPLLILMGAGDRIVGAPTFVMNDANLARHLPQAEAFGGSLTTVNCEQIIALKPDLVIEYVKYQPLCNQRIIDMGIPILYFNSFNIPDMRNNSEQFGILTGNADIADRYNEYLAESISALDSRIANHSGIPPRIYLEYSTDYMTFGKGSTGQDLISIIHGDNIAKDIEIEFPTITPEWIVQEDPDVMIKLVSSSSMRDNTTTLQKSYSDFVSRPGYSNLSAVKNHRVYVLSYDLILYTRQIIGINYMAKIVYPAEFSDVNPEDSLHDFAGRFHTYADQIPTVYPPLA